MAKQQGALFKKMIEQNRLRISLKELSIASGVSGRQLRYWEQKGYIKSEQSEVGKAHKYTLQTMYAVITIKNFLDQGYTLAKAVEIEKRHRRVRQTVRRFIRNNILKVQESEDALRVNIGQLADHPGHDVEVVVAAPQEKVELRLVEHQERKSGKNGRKD